MCVCMQEAFSDRGRPYSDKVLGEVLLNMWLFWGHNIVMSILVLPTYLHGLRLGSDVSHIMAHTVLICSAIKGPCK